MDSSEKALVCQTCGDKGFTNAFIFCVKCLDFVVHRYCLKLMPKTFDELVIWYCEKCKATVGNQVTSGSQKEEALRSGQGKPSHRNKTQKERDIASILAGTLVTNCQEKTIAQDNYDWLSLPVIDPVWSVKWCMLRARLEGKGGCPNTDGGCYKLPFHLKRKILTCLYSRIYPFGGSFSIDHTDYDVLEGFVAHLSNNACDKVCQEANMLPSLLHLEMHPKTVLWPKSFQEREPSDDNIALYFFPGDSINEWGFDRLVVDMINGSLAMRATAKNAELLVFTSRVLPRPIWRFKGKYYLWGVFRGKRKDSSSDISKESPMRMKRLGACSPRSPLSSNGDPESGD